MNVNAISSLLLGTVFALTGPNMSPVQANEPPTGQPYAGQQQRAIKALSAEEIEGYRNGAGLGMAKAAELNHYPGPLHVLELAGQLKLSGAQKKKIQALYQQMKTDASQLGIKIIALESELDRLFATGKIRQPELNRLVTEIARNTGRLRATHLRVHLKTKPLLSAAQLVHYDRLRGYGLKKHGTNKHESHGH